MRIVIDMQGAQTDSRFRGIGRYSLSIAQAIVRNAGKHEVLLILNAKLPESIPEIRNSFKGLIPDERIRVFEVPQSEKFGDWSSLAAEAIREKFIESLNPDITLITSVFEGYHSNAVTSVGVYAGASRTAAILYDLIPLICPDNYLSNDELKIYYYRKIDWLKNAGLLLAISDSSRNEAIAELGVSEDRILNISTAIDARFSIAASAADTELAVLESLGISRGFLLYAPGGFDSRKNFARLIESYSLLTSDIRSSYQLVIVSKLSPQHREDLNQIASDHGLSADELVLPGYVDDEDLIKLYRLARLFVFPSLHEGFGLPLLEAMACGAPVIGSNTTSIPEVIGFSGALFDPTSVDEMTVKILSGLTDETFRENLLTHQKQQVAKFSWDKTAQVAIYALEKLYQKSKHTHEITNDLIYVLGNLPRNAKLQDSSLREVANCIAFNQGSEQQQLLLDISTIVQTDARTGIQRVVRSLLKQLLDNSADNMCIKPIYFDGSVYRYASMFCQEKFNKKIAENDEAIDFWQGDIYLSLDLNMHITNKTQAFHRKLNNRGVRVCYVVYDILLANHPEWWGAENANYFLTWLTNIGEVATDLICISNTVANEVTEWYRRNPPNRIEDGPRISSFHLGADMENSLPSAGLPTIDECILDGISEHPSFLMVGTIEPRKGHEQVVHTFEQLWLEGLDINLVIVGKQGWMVDELVAKLSSNPELNKRLFWLDGISDQYLEKVYAASTCLIAASYAEGFGLPLIEAAQHHLPIIARDIPVFREVAGEHAYYFKASTSGELAQSINSWLKLYETNSHPKSDEMPWLTWHKSSEDLIRILLGNADQNVTKAPASDSEDAEYQKSGPLQDNKAELNGTI